jgi:DNA polymerase III alpha subunit (gram-positive type)
MRLNNNNLYGKSLQDILEVIDNLENKTLIFFDTETTGFSPKTEQLIEIAALACEFNNFNVLDKFYEKVKLLPNIEKRMKPGTSEYENWKSRIKISERFQDPRDVLKMTRFGETPGTRSYYDEKSLLENFSNFVNSYDKPILIAHNAPFDMKMVNTRMKLYGLKPLNVSVLDTNKILKLFFLPMLKVLKKGGNQLAGDFLNKLLVPVIGIDGPVIEPELDWKTKQPRLNPDGTPKMKQKKYYSTSMGVVAPAFNINIDEWHNALADIKLMIGMFNKTIQLFKKYRNTDIKEPHALAVKGQRYKKIMSKKSK